MKLMTHKFIFTIIICIVLLASIAPSNGSAQAGSAYELIAEVNALRTSRGLAPYSIDSGLMSFAQSQSNYMASLGYWTHTRSDGSTAWDHGIKENVAMGTNMSTYYCVYNIWSDYVHWKTMVDYATGSVGAGVASDDSNIYYTLNVRPGAAIVPVANQPAPPAQVTEVTPWIQPVITSTPDKNGILTHIVKYGETLWLIAIAYDTTMREILINSGINPNTTDVFEGQVLTIRTAADPTATLPPTETPIQPSPTSTPPRPTRTPLPSLTPGPSPTPTNRPPIMAQAFADGKKVGVGLIAISALGLLLVAYFGFIKKPRA